MRRAIYHGRHALFMTAFNEEDLFFYKVTDFVVQQMRDAYPELESARDFIERIVKLEESRFASTLSIGLQKLDALLASHRIDTALFEEGTVSPLPDFKDLALTHGLRACWSMPIAAQNGSVIGTFACYYREPRMPGSTHLQLIDRATHLAGIAIEPYGDMGNTQFGRGGHVPITFTNIHVAEVGGQVR